MMYLVTLFLGLKNFFYFEKKIFFEKFENFLLSFLLLDYKVCFDGLQGMPSWASRYAIIGCKVCHHELQGMPSWTLRYAIGSWVRLS